MAVELATARRMALAETRRVGLAELVWRMIPLGNTDLYKVHIIAKSAAFCSTRVRIKRYLYQMIELITFLLCEKEVLLKPVLYLSYYFKRNRQRYYDSLQAVRDRGDWELWLLFFLRGVFEVSQQATETARRVLLLREQHRQLITDEFGRAAGNGHRVLEHLYQQPIISVANV